MVEVAVGVKLMLGAIRNRLWAFVIAVGLVAPAYWMLIDRGPPYEITNGRIEPERPVKNGYIMVTWDIKPLRTCRPSDRYKSTRQIIDSKGVIHLYQPEPGLYGTPQAMEDELQRHVPLPMNTTGEARYSAVACYQCNLVQIFWPICVTTPTLEFTITDTEK